MEALKYVEWKRSHVDGFSPADGGVSLLFADFTGKISL